MERMENADLGAAGVADTAAAVDVVGAVGSTGVASVAAAPVVEAAATTTAFGDAVNATPGAAVGAAPATAAVPGEPARLELADLSCGYSGNAVLEHVSLRLEAGEVCCVLGPNGVGKTTLFKSVLGSLPLLGGRVLLDGQDAIELTQAQLARKIAYVPQAHTPPFPFTVLDVVEMGRTAHLGLLSAPSQNDRALALEALNTLGIAQLSDRLYTQISGGERQMVLIARALVQQADVLVMDEPTASLDYGNQVEVLSYVRQLADAGFSVLMTTHAPDHVFRCADTVLAVRGNGSYGFGPVEAVMTEELLRELYGVELQILGEGTGRVVVPKPDAASAERRAAIASFLQRG